MSKIDEFIKDNIDSFKQEFKSVEECGRIISVQDEILHIVGLNNVFLHEVIELQDLNILNLNKQKALVISIQEHIVIAICFSKYNIGVENTIAKRTHKFIEVMLHENMLGHIFNGYGEPVTNIIINKGILQHIILKPPSILDIRNNNKQLITGTPIIDIFIPLAYGQRQALIGDAATGKTTILTNIIKANAMNKNVICIYLSIGQNITNVKIIENKMRKFNCTQYIIISVSASAYSIEKYISPYIAITIGEYFKTLNYDVIIFIDDMNNHALAYQDIMLRIKQPMGKEGWPADIFYQHALILSMGHIHKTQGSITIIPVVVSLEEDISDYLITNIMSITDGQIVTSNKLSQMVKYPAININKSVSRIGRSIQYPYFKKLCTEAVQIILKYNNLKELAILANDNNLDEESQRILNLGSKLYEFIYDGECHSFLYSLMVLYMYIEKNYDSINSNYLTTCINNNINNENIEQVILIILKEYQDLLGV